MTSLTSYQFGKDPLRDYIKIPAGRYLIKEPIILDPEPVVIGGVVRQTRGWGPHIDARGVVLVVSPDFVGDRVFEVVGNKPVIEGLVIDSRWKAVDYGVMFRAKNVGGMEASGGRGSWRGGGIVGVFNKSALYLDSAEELNFELNIVNEGAGNGVTLANGGLLPSWSMTQVNFNGCSIQVRGNDIFRIVGDVNDCIVRDSFLAGPHSAVSMEGTGKRNKLDGCRFECSKTSTIIKGTGWSRGTTVLNVSPIVSGWTARGPLPANTIQLSSNP